jgi:hypothetical protein
MGSIGDAPRAKTFRGVAAAEKMNLLSYFKVAISSTLGAALVGCAGSGEPATPAVIRTAPPQNVEKTVTNYLAFKIREPQKNAEISVGAPEPSACVLDAYTSRGWVVPVVYVTRSGEVTGKDTIRINAKQYYFWFLSNTIAGVTPRIDLCPGVGATFESPPANPTAVGLVTTGLPVAAPGEAQRRGETDTKAASVQAPKATSSAKKTGTSSAKARPPVKTKAGNSRSKAKPTT